MSDARRRVFRSQGVGGWRGWLTRLASGATTGAIQGGITGGAPGAATGAVVGGTLLPAAGKAADWVQARWGDALRPAVQKIYQAVVRDGMTPQDLQNAITQLGANATAADVGRTNLKNLAEAVANSPGPGSQIAAQYVGARTAGQTQRLNDAVKLATGATGSAQDTMAGLQDARSAAAAPKYQAAFNNTTVTPEQATTLAPYIADPIGQKALQNGLNDLRVQALADGKPFRLADYGVTQNPDGSYALAGDTPNLRLYDAVKRGYDSIVEGFRDPTTGKLALSGTTSVPGAQGQYSGTALNNLRQTYTGQLRSLFPRYGDALDAWAGPSADMDALTMGRRVLTADPDITETAIKSMTPSQRQTFQVGMAQALNDRIDATPDGADAVRRVWGNDLLRSRIAAGFGGRERRPSRTSKRPWNARRSWRRPRGCSGARRPHAAPRRWRI